MLSLTRNVALKTCPELLAAVQMGWAASFRSATCVMSSGEAAVASSSATEAIMPKNQAQAAKLRRVLSTPVQMNPAANRSSPSEIQRSLELFQLHNSSIKVSGGHMIKARVLHVDKRKIVLDAGIKMAKISASDITPDCILETAPDVQGLPPRVPGEVRPGDVVQIYLEHEETPEGDMLVSGQQAAVRRRVRAVWRELQDCMAFGRPVKGRVLNSIAGGYAVGVGGLVCFLPGSTATSTTTRRIGELQDFKVRQMNPARNNVVLTDNRIHQQQKRPGGGGGIWRYQQQQQKREREVVKEADGIAKDLGAAAAVAHLPTPASYSV